MTTPTRTKISRLEALPVELVQQIAWDAQNPTIYLTSKTIMSKLPRLEDYEFDLMLLLWCDRHQVERIRNEVIPLGWSLITDNDFPWQTATARAQNWKPTTAQRLCIQRSVFDLAWLTERKFRSTARKLLEAWLSRRWPDEHMFASGQKERIHADAERSDILLKSCLPMEKPISFCAAHIEETGEESFEIWPGCQISVSLNVTGVHRYQRGSFKHTLMDTLYIPPQVLEGSNSSAGDLLPLMRHSRALGQRMYGKMGLIPYSVTGSIEFSHTTAMQALRSAIQRRDKIAFIRLFGLFISQLSLEDMRQLDSKIADELVVKLPYDAGDRVSWNFEPPWAIDGIPLGGFDRNENRPPWRDINALFDIVASSTCLERCIGLSVI